MADYNCYSPNTHPIAEFLVGNGNCSSDELFQPPNSAFNSVSLLPSQTKKTAQEGNAVIPVKLAEEPMEAFTVVMFLKNHFKLKIVLKQSDVDGSSQLVLPMNCVEKYILSRIDPSEAQLCRTCTGKEFAVLDVDDDSMHHLVMKKWKNTYFILAGNWIPDFVKRKHLDAGDLIGIALFNTVLFFKLLKKNEN